jgi:hypothetical protein
VENRKDYMTVREGLFVRLEAKPGKEADVENFLRGGLPIVESEPQTIAWFALRLGPSTSVFLMRFRMMPVARLTFKGEWRRR